MVRLAYTNAQSTSQYQKAFGYKSYNTDIYQYRELWYFTSTVVYL